MILDQLADRVSAAIWNLHPGWAVAAGKHEYDGQVPDLSAEAVTAGLERLGRLQAQLEALDGLADAQELDRATLLGVIGRERGDGEAGPPWRRHPGWYLEPLDVSVYLERDYAPAGLRLERAAEVLGETGVLLEAARRNLEGVLSRAGVEVAASRARDLAARLAVQAEWAAAAGGASAEGAWLQEAAGFAAAQLEAYAAWLEAERLPQASETVVLGPGGIERWLLAAEGWTGRVDHRRDAWWARLRRDQEDFAADAARLFPGVSAAEACRRLGAGAVADGPGEARRALDQARRFAARAGLAPVGAAPVVLAAPGMRGEAEAGWLQAPGPYDDPGTPAALLVVPGASAAAMDALAVTEGLPGRVVAVRGAAGAAGEARRRFPSLAFQDGWSLFAGDLMLEAGFREDAPGWRLLWRRRAIRAGCGLALGAGLHCGEISLEQAERGFVEEAGLNPAAAREEARRCAHDPGRMLAGLGRLEIISARSRVAGSSLPGFCSQALACAAGPLGLLDRLRS